MSKLISFSLITCRAHSVVRLHPDASGDDASSNMNLRSVLSKKLDWSWGTSSSVVFSFLFILQDLNEAAFTLDLCWQMPSFIVFVFFYIWSFDYSGLLLPPLRMCLSPRQVFSFFLILVHFSGNSAWILYSICTMHTQIHTYIPWHRCTCIASQVLSTHIKGKRKSKKGKKILFKSVLTFLL